jgi:hypothetical protein
LFTCVYEASFESLTPIAADILKPDPQIPLKPVSSTILADKPLCASIKKDKSADVIICFNCVVRFGLEIELEAEAELKQKPNRKYENTKTT